MNQSIACEVLPVSAFQSTNLNNKLQTFDDLGERIKRTLGHPLISLEIHRDQLYNNIQIAIEYFSKFAGYTKEFLIFDSQIYQKNRGIRLDQLFTLAKAGITDAQKVASTPRWPGPDFNVEVIETFYISTSTIPSQTFSTSETLSSLFTDGLEEFQILDESIYNNVITFNGTLSSYFRPSVKKKPSLQSEPATPEEYSNVFDYDIMDYRKVIAITEFEEGSNQSINTLFTLEQTLAQQTYFSYALGNYGFDLVSWYTMKEWLDTREKVLAIRRDIRFDERTQYMQIIPQPRNSRFYGVIGCYLERPLRDLIKEPWVYEYALALSKINIGRARGKFTGVSLLGGGSLNTDLLQEGIQDKERLEKMLLEGATPGWGDSEPPIFFLG
jgi:hypothetical protein